MLAEKLLQQHRERGWQGSSNGTGARFCQLVLLELLGASLCLRIGGLLFGCEAHRFNQTAVLPSGTGRAKNVSPYRFARFVFALEDGHQFPTSTSGGCRSPVAG